MVETVRCEHCDAQTKHPVTKTIDGRVLNFCCGGCLQVYELLREEGLPPAQSGGGTPARVQPEPVHPVDRPLGGTVPSKTITLPIVGMTCANCVARVEGSLRSVPGVLNANVNLATERATVEMILGAAMIADLRHAVEEVGYKILDLGDSDEELVDHRRAPHV